MTLLIVLLRGTGEKVSGTLREKCCRVMGFENYIRSEFSADTSVHSVAITREFLQLSGDAAL
ncbi:MAG TPA: hypothetical protein VN642_11410 [Dongiaceae bacterium]|nr:hypothetical protein [Dongiaceae bacterium]